MVTSYFLCKDDRQEERLGEGGNKSIFRQKNVLSQRGRKWQLCFCGPARIIQMWGLHNVFHSYKWHNSAGPNRNTPICLLFHLCRTEVSQNIILAVILKYEMRLHLVHQLAYTWVSLWFPKYTQWVGLLYTASLGIYVIGSFAKAIVVLPYMTEPLNLNAAVNAATYKLSSPLPSTF